MNRESTKICCQVVFFILKYLNIQRYSDLEILEACGKLDTNCFEIKQNGLNLRAMYRTACIMSHNCRSVNQPF